MCVLGVNHTKMEMLNRFNVVVVVGEPSHKHTHGERVNEQKKNHIHNRRLKILGAVVSGYYLFLCVVNCFFGWHFFSLGFVVNSKLLTEP